jgi:hypothetical protein
MLLKLIDKAPGELGALPTVTTPRQRLKTFNTAFIGVNLRYLINSGGDLSPLN